MRRSDAPFSWLSLSCLAPWIDTLLLVPLTRRAPPKPMTGAPISTSVLLNSFTLISSPALFHPTTQLSATWVSKPYLKQIWLTHNTLFPSTLCLGVSHYAVSCVNVNAPRPLSPTQSGNLSASHATKANRACTACNMY